MECPPVDKRIEGERLRRLTEALEAECGLTAELLGALQAERASIVAGRLEDLYAGCRQRTELLAGLQAAQEATAGLLRALGASPGDLTALIRRALPRERPRLRRVRAEINRLRRQVAALSEENRRCIAEALDFIDGAVAILTGASPQAGHYGGHSPKSGPAVISSEV